MCLYYDPHSLNSYKVRLLLGHLQISYEERVIDLLKDENHSPEFRRVSFTGQVPLLRLQDGSYLAESNAILLHLAEGSDLLIGTSRLRVLEWLFFEQCQLQASIKRLYSLLVFWGVPEADLKGVDDSRRRSVRALAVLEQQLANYDFLVGNTYSIADIALFAYAHVAPTVGVNLAQFPSIPAWMDRIRAQPNHVTPPGPPPPTRQRVDRRPIQLRYGR